MNLMGKTGRDARSRDASQVTTSHGLSGGRGAAPSDRRLPRRGLRRRRDESGLLNLKTLEMFGRRKAVI
jgi:hypothetical protein